MKKAELIAEVRSSHQEWEEALSRIPQEKMDIPGTVGSWSVKDVVAHVSWGEREMVGVLKTRALVGSPLWSLGNAERNQIVYQENKDRSLEDVLSESHQLYIDLMAELEKIEDEDLIDPGRIREMPPDWQLWQVLAGNTFEHYRDHARDLRISDIYKPENKKA